MPRSRWETHIEPFMLEIEGWVRNGVKDEDIARKLGVAYSTFRKYVAEKPQLKEIMLKGKEHVDVQVENALLKRALGFTCTEVIEERIVDTGQNKRHNEAQSMTEKEWEIAKAYFKNTCSYCGSSTELTKDHVKPLVKGGTLDRFNVIPACQRCNSSKKDNDWEDWYKGQSFYDMKREEKIKEYLTFMEATKEIVNATPEANMVVTKIIRREEPPNTTAQMFWLKNRRPEIWRDKHDIEHSGEVKTEKLADIIAQLGGEVLEE